MSYDIVKFERGQIWMIRFKYPNECVGHEQQKDRPWLILSVGKFNKSSGMITAAPITTRDYIRTPAQVVFTNDRGTKNVILCENIRTFDYSSGAYILEFMGVLSDDIMERVDVALSIHLGMHYSPITLNKLYESMEAIIKSVGHMQAKAEEPKFTDDDVLNFAEKLKMLASDATRVEDFDKSFSTTRMEVSLESGDNNYAVHESTTSIIKPYYIRPEYDEEDTPKVEKRVWDVPADTKEDAATAKTPRIRWTQDKCQEFLQDADNLPMKQVMDKWNISKKTRYYSMKNYVQGLMMKMTQE